MSNKPRFSLPALSAFPSGTEQAGAPKQEMHRICAAQAGISDFRLLIFKSTIGPGQPGRPKAGADNRQSTISGFTLIELIISIAILSVGLVGAMRVFPVGLRASHRAELSSRATIVAQREMELLKLLSWEELAVGETTATEDDFTVTTRIAEAKLDELVDPGRLKTIEVMVEWTDDGRSRNVVVVTYLRRPVP